jgi:hypothetical protein
MKMRECQVGFCGPTSYIPQKTEVQSLEHTEAGKGFWQQRCVLIRTSSDWKTSMPVALNAQFARETHGDHTLSVTVFRMTTPFAPNPRKKSGGGVGLT